MIAGLWDVDDSSTPELMKDFYEELNKKNSVGAALRKAKLKMVKSGAPFNRPYYWASLQLYAGS